MSALTVSKEYTASPKKFDKKQAKKMAKLSKQNSKKNSLASTAHSEGYHSDEPGPGRVNEK